MAYKRFLCVFQMNVREGVAFAVSSASIAPRFSIAPRLPPGLPAIAPRDCPRFSIAPGIAPSGVALEGNSAVSGFALVLVWLR